MTDSDLVFEQYNVQAQCAQLQQNPTVLPTIVQTTSQQYVTAQL